MNIAFLINQTHKEQVNFTTTIFALEALLRGHTVHYIGLADFVYMQENDIEAYVRTVYPMSNITSRESLIQQLKDTTKTRLSMKQIDVLWLRYDPTLDMYNRPWAAAMGLQFAQLIKNMGRLVINDPDSLAQANNKLYLENFPLEVRPETIVTRNYEDVINFIDKKNSNIILKPLKGSGGLNVFMITPHEQQNLKQTVDVIARDGYVIVQEYLPEATKGDMRFFLLEGEPIVINGKYAAVQRVQKSGELRSNIHQGATTEIANVTQETLDLVSKVKDRLKDDNMYLVGLDIVGDKIMEINVFSPGALSMTMQLNQINYAEYIIEHLEDKVSNFYSH